MTIVLITGMSGTGKSTVAGELERRGLFVVRTDDPGWCLPANGDWSIQDNEWIWDEERINAAIDAAGTHHLVIEGCRENQGQFYHRIDRVIVLTAPLAVMLTRLEKRTSNPYGKTPDEKAGIRRFKSEVEPLLISNCDLVINTFGVAPTAIADRIEALL